jgi:hypothetical protein
MITYSLTNNIGSSNRRTIFNTHSASIEHIRQNQCVIVHPKQRYTGQWRMLVLTPEGFECNKRALSYKTSLSWYLARSNLTILKFDGNFMVYQHENEYSYRDLLNYVDLAVESEYELRKRRRDKARLARSIELDARNEKTMEVTL